MNDMEGPINLDVFGQRVRDLEDSIKMFEGFIEMIQNEPPSLMQRRQINIDVFRQKIAGWRKEIAEIEEMYSQHLQREIEEMTV